MVARSSISVLPDSKGIVAQALTLQDRTAPLAHVDAEAWDAASDALRAAADPEGPAQSRGVLEQALDRAAAIPLEVAELGADVAALGAVVAEHGEAGVPGGCRSRRRAGRRWRARRRPPRRGQPRDAPRRPAPRAGPRIGASRRRVRPSCSRLDPVRMQRVTSLSTLTDAELVQRCRNGDADAWNELVERFSRYVYAVCARGFRLTEADAEDVYQEVFARAYTHLGSLRDDSALRPWIAQLTRRLCIDQVARGRREQPVAELVSDDIARDLDEIEEAFAVREALATLPEPCRDILDRFFTRDQSYRTISTELDLPAGTIASRIARCLVKLREQLEGRSEPSSESGV